MLPSPPGSWPSTDPQPFPLTFLCDVHPLTVILVGTEWAQVHSTGPVGIAIRHGEVTGSTNQEPVGQGGRGPELRLPKTHFTQLAVEHAFTEHLLCQAVCQAINGSQPPDLQEHARRTRQAGSRLLQKKAGGKPAPILHEGQPGKRGPGLSLRMLTRPPGEDGEEGHSDICVACARGQEA